MFSKVINFFLLLGSIVLTLTVMELSFKFFHPIPYTVPIQMYYESDKYTSYKNKPNAIGYWQQGNKATTNSFGHRDDETTLKPATQVYRILVLGDSFTVGAGVGQDETYPQRMEVILREKLPEKNIEIINAGVAGWSPFQYAQYYKYYGKHFAPDAVLVGFFVGNDTYAPTFSVEDHETTYRGMLVTREALRKKGIGLKVFCYEKFNLVRLLLNKGKFVAKDHSRENCQDFNEQYIKVQKSRINTHRKRSEANIGLAEKNVAQVKRIKEITNQQRIPLIVILIPDENQLNQDLQKLVFPANDMDKFDFEMPQKMLRELFVENEMPTIDLLAAFQKAEDCLYLNDTHWNSDGHDFAAQEIIKQIIERRLLPIMQESRTSKANI